jgi:hypothetical protein
MSDDVFCSQCGHRNGTDANFCSACGSRLALGTGADDLTLTLHPLSPEGEPGARDVVVRLNADGPAVLILERGSDAGLTFPLDAGSTTAGRNPECEIFLDDITVSRKHAVIRHGDAGYVIRDEGSLNGTYVNGERISSANLRSGDEVLIGKFRLLFLDASDSRRVAS